MNAVTTTNTDGPANTRARRIQASVALVIAAACALAVCSAAGVAQRIGARNVPNDFYRVWAPGAPQTQLPAKTMTVFRESRSGQPPILAVRVVRERDGLEIPIQSLDKSVRYQTPSRQGVSVGTITIPTTDTYIVISKGSGNPRYDAIAFGNIATAHDDAWYIAGLVLCIGLLIAAALTYRRERHTKP